ncbi:MAG: hypothetical protein ABI778_07320 [Ignavibacteriota bacterium]
MNHEYTSLPRIAMQEISILLGKNTGMNIDASLSHACELLNSQGRGGILFINTVQSPRAMYNSARSHGIEPTSCGNSSLDPYDNKQIQFLNVPRGDLHKSRDILDYHLSEGDYQYIFINSWEFAAKNSRYREEAVFLLKELAAGMSQTDDFEPVTIVIYGEDKQVDIPPQKIQRNGFGKLQAIAKFVGKITSEKQFVTKEQLHDREDIVKEYYAQEMESEMTFESSEALQEMDQGHAKELDEPKTRRTPELYLAPVFIPGGFAAHGRSDQMREPIILNGYGADKLPVRSRANSRIAPMSKGSGVHREVVESKEVAGG